MDELNPLLMEYSDEGNTSKQDEIAEKNPIETQPPVTETQPPGP